MLLVGVLVSLLCGPARAGDDDVPPAAARGAGGHLVLRLDATAQPLDGSVIAHLTPAGGPTVDLPLNDAGTRPDSAAGDHVWTGLGLVEGDHAKVTVTAGAWTGDAGDLPIAAGRPRELNLQITGGKLVVAPAGTPAIGVPGWTGHSPRGKDGAGEQGSGAQDDGAEHAHRHTKTATDDSNDTLWYVAAAAGGVCLLAIGLFWFRGPARAAPLPEGVRRLPDVGIFGPGTPALTAGVSQWVVDDADAPDLVRHLAATVASLRPVLVHAPDDLLLPGAPLGPAFRAWYAKPAQLQDAAYDLQEAEARLVLILAPTPSPLHEWTAYIGKDLPILAVVTAVSPGAGVVVRCSRVDGAWVYSPVA